MDWIDVILKVGFPITLCLAGGWGVVKAARWLAPRLEGWINRLVTSHEDLTKSCIAIGESNNKTLRSLEVVSVAQQNSILRIEKSLESLCNDRAQSDAKAAPPGPHLP